MNLNDFPFTESITAVIAAAIGWVTSGRFNAKSSEIDNAKKLIDEWMRLHSGCEERVKQLEAKFEQHEKKAEIERQDLKDTILKQNGKIEYLQSQIKKLETK